LNVKGGEKKKTVKKHYEEDGPTYPNLDEKAAGEFSKSGF